MQRRNFILGSSALSLGAINTALAQTTCVPTPTTPTAPAAGIDVVAQLCQRLIDGGAPAIHFYALNQSALTLEICRRLDFI